jgi:hypothetical protein
MKLIFATLGLLVVSQWAVTEALAEPKTSSTGVACNSTGTARKDGKDQDGNKVNCLWDTCTYCGTTSGQIDCSRQVTEYSNPRDCKAAKSIFGGAGQSRLFDGNLNLQFNSSEQPDGKTAPNGTLVPKNGRLKAN